MFDAFDSVTKLIGHIRDAVALAKERTPTQRDRIAEALFISAVKKSRATDLDTLNAEAEAAGFNCYETADEFLKGKADYEKNRKNQT
jgi:hypothetical protein